MATEQPRFDVVVAWPELSERTDASGPFPRSDHCPFASRAAAPRTGVPVVTAEARSAPTLLRRLLVRCRAASVGRLLRRRRASDSHAAATVAAAPAGAVAPAARHSASTRVDLRSAGAMQ
jgi:hypothetical protein